MRPTRVTSKTIYLINNIFTNLVFDTSLKLKKGIIKKGIIKKGIIKKGIIKKGIIKSDVSDHFPVIVSLNSPSKIHKENQKITIHKRIMHGTNLMAFKTGLRNVNWN